MTCKIYKLLFWLLPLKRWQAFLIHYHFYKCYSCREESGIDDHFNQIPIFPSDCQNHPSLWPQIKKKIALEKEKKNRKKSFIFFPKWQWTLLVIGLICIFLLLPYLSKKNSNFKFTENIESIQRGSKIILKSVKMENQPAKTYFFQSNHPDRLIVWVQKSTRE